MNKRQIKNLLYGHVAQIGKALASPKRLELLELLSQSPKTVEALAQETAMDVKLTSAHLKALKIARLVQAERHGKFMLYRLSGDDVAKLWVNLRETAAEHLVEFSSDVVRLIAQPEKLTSLNREDLAARAKSGDLIVIDVRPAAEFEVAHLPYAKSMPMSELKQRLAELPKDKEIVAYCRGPFCVFADEALRLLRDHGYRAFKTVDGVNEWVAAGLPVETNPSWTPH
ncbi:MAG: metalloregulator ArsR/SmtB family transcription factor [Burkholderiaceae bacterium]|nr:metalloregulator ArsR/SmtB family transcription factor [Burkholderiaceae bacterium]MCD8517647.1 metalloregulator ArsR/SmtB family transcription factor [Burkholderiaceae bacterium]MCD8536074.1 metalloregulator ArsR/SmtB family transcription factor [Burkholderiaceae bacterium]